MKAPVAKNFKLILFLLSCVLFSAYALSSFAKIIQSYLAVEYSFTTELVLVMGQVPFQWLFIWKRPWKDKVNYMTIALGVSGFGSLLLFPLLVLEYFLVIDPIYATSYFFFVVGVIFVIHCLLIFIQGLPKILTISWVIYRILILVYVLVPR